jgi:hypothetical protein
VPKPYRALADHGNESSSKVRNLRILSEPQELIGKFREEGDFETAIKHIEKDNADNAKKELQRSWKETYYWPMI